MRKYIVYFYLVLLELGHPYFLSDNPLVQQNRIPSGSENSDWDSIGEWKKNWISKMIFIPVYWETCPYCKSIYFQLIKLLKKRQEDGFYLDSENSQMED